MDILDQPESSPKTGRPIPLTILCVLIFLGVALAIPFAILDANKILEIGELFPEWYTWFVGAGALVWLASGIGLWKMKKWGAYIYVPMVIVEESVSISVGTASMFTFSMHALGLIIVFMYFRRMD